MTKRGVWFASPLFPQFLRGVSPRAVKTDGSAFPARKNSPRIKFGGCLLNAEIFTILLMNFGKGFKPDFVEKLNLYRGFSGQ